MVHGFEDFEFAPEAGFDALFLVGPGDGVLYDFNGDEQRGVEGDRSGIDGDLAGIRVDCVDFLRKGLGGCENHFAEGAVADDA